MTGPECYQEALRHVEVAYGARDHGEAAAAAQELAFAQVFATLALAAATALGTWNESGMPQPDRMDWWRAASGEPAERERVKEANRAEFAAEARP